VLKAYRVGASSTLVKIMGELEIPVTIDNMGAVGSQAMRAFAWSTCPCYDGQHSHGADRFVSRRGIL